MRLREFNFNSHYRFLVLLIFLLNTIMFFSSLSGQTYSLEELIRHARENDELLQIFQLDKNAVSMQQSQLIKSYLPAFNLNASYFHQSEVATLTVPFSPGNPIQAGVYDQYDFFAEINQLVFDGFRRHFQSKQLSVLSGEKAYQEQYRDREIQYIITQLVYQYQLQTALLNSLKSSRLRLEIQKDRIMALYRSGFRSPLDTLEISNRLKELNMQQSDVVGALDQILAEIKHLCQLNSIDSIAVPETELNPLPSTDTLSLSNNYQVQLLNFQKENLKWQIKKRTHLFLPKVYFSAAYHRGKPGVNFFENKWMNYWTLGVKFQWNLFKWGTDRQTIQLDRLKLKQLDYQSQHVLKQLKIQAEKLQIQLKTLREKLISYDIIANQQKQKYELIRKQWQEGQIATLDVLDAEQEYTMTDFQKKAIRIRIKLLELAIQQLNGFMKL